MKPKKPGYDSEAVQGELVEQVCSFFGRIFDDFEVERHAALRGHKPGDDKWAEIMEDDPTINETAEEFCVTPMKVRKILITGGCYDTEIYREIKKMRERGLTVEEIGRQIKKKPITVRSYLPYERVIYNLEERSVNADKLQRFKQRWGGYKKPKVVQSESQEELT